MRNRLGFWALVAAFLLTSCASKPAAEGPILVTFQDYQSGNVQSVGGASYGDITSRIAALPQKVFKGTDTQITESLVNQGSPSKGVRVVIKGPALELLGAPKDAFIESSSSADGKDKTLGHAELTFAADGAGGLEAKASNLEFQKDLRIVMSLPAVQGGEGDLRIFVYPLDKKGKTNVVFAKHFTILSESDDTPSPEAPTE